MKPTAVANYKALVESLTGYHLILTMKILKKQFWPQFSINSGVDVSGFITDKNDNV